MRKFISKMDAAAARMTTVSLVRASFTLKRQERITMASEIKSAHDIRLLLVWNYTTLEILGFDSRSSKNLPVLDNSIKF